MRFIAIAPLILTIAGCERARPPAQKGPTPVNAAAVDLYTPASGQRYSATIMPARQVVVGFPVSGVVESVAEVRGDDGVMRTLQPGDAVTEGGMLAKVSQKNYEFQVTQATGQLAEARRAEEGARAQLAQAQAGAAKAAKDLDRATFLFDNKALIRPDLEAARTQSEVAKAQVEAAQSQVQAAVARIGAVEGAVGAASLTRDETVLRSPLSGVVVQRNVEPGGLAGPSASAFAIADIEKVKVVFGAPDSVAVKLRNGTRVPVEVEAFTGQRFEGVISGIAPAADATTRLFQIEVTVSNPRHLLRPGMIAAIALGTGPRIQPVPAIPLSAVVPAGQSSSSFAVMIVDGKVARRRAVSLGESWGDKIGILSGLSAGERVITRGASAIEDGETVEVIP